jgi:hypothetical protein
MSLTLAMVVGLTVGLFLLVVISRRLALLLWVFWHEALMYFGLLPYPHEVGPRRRIRPASSAPQADRNPPSDSS